MQFEISYVCPKCFQDTALRARILELTAQHQSEPCSTHDEIAGVPLSSVGRLIEDAIATSFVLSDFYHPQYDEWIGDDLDSVINMIAQPVDQEISQAICQYLIYEDSFNEQPDGTGRFFTENSVYQQRFTGGGGQSLLWDEFRCRIQFGQRFFNDAAKDLLGKIFAQIHLQRDAELKSPIWHFQPSDSLIYRARVLKGSEEEAVINDPAEQLGPPPERLRRQGRMNAPGILAFYGAFEAATCVTELRPPVGSLVAVAAFEVVRPLTLLDLTRFQSKPKDRNVFSLGYKDRMSQWSFMEKFASEISNPILPDDEVFDYIPTQVVAEYLVNHHDFGRAKRRTAIDGIIFRSAQRQVETGLSADLRNIVLFGDAAIVEGTKAVGSENAHCFSIGEYRDPIVPALRYKAESLSIKRVSGVAVATKSLHDPEDPNEPEIYYR